MFGAGSPVDALDQVAVSAGVDVLAWRHCRFSRAARAVVERDIEEGVQAGVKSTPTFIIGKRLVSGAQSRADLAAIIREELASAGAVGG
jgi:predicted DsbA family dithiol-disulfide isomerase